MAFTRFDAPGARELLQRGSACATTCGDSPSLAGGGVFLLASLVKASLDVGIREGSGVRLHFTTGVQF